MLFTSHSVPQELEFADNQEMLQSHLFPWILWLGYEEIKWGEVYFVWTYAYNCEQLCTHT